MPFTVRGYRFRRVVSRADRLSPTVAATYVTDVRAGDALVSATTRERTLVDCLARLDLICVGQLKVSAMRAEPPRVDARLRAVVGKLGYAVRGTNHDHSGQAYRLKYGDEYVKIDVLSASGLRPAVWLAPSLSPPRSTAQGGGESIKLLLTSHYIITLYLYFVIDIQAGMEYLFQA